MSAARARENAIPARLPAPHAGRPQAGLRAPLRPLANEAEGRYSAAAAARVEKT